MTSQINICAAGMVTAVGLDCVSSCAALRGRIDGFQETRFVGANGDWQIGAPVPLPRQWIGVKRLAHLVAGAIVEVLRKSPDLADPALILCLAEEDRPGRLPSDGGAFAQMVADIVTIDSKRRIALVTHGRPAGFVAVDRARRMIKSGEATDVIVAGVDSYLTGPSVAHYLAAQRLLGPDSPNGFIPGEAAAAVLVSGETSGKLVLTGLGIAREEAFLYNGLDEDGDHLPLRGDGMTSAYKMALDQAGLAMANIDYRISDLIGEQFFFKQTGLAAQRLNRNRKDFQDLWSPGESLGNIGASSVPVMLGMALTAAQKRYAPGGAILIEASSDAGACGAAVLQTRKAA